MIRRVVLAVALVICGAAASVAVLPAPAASAACPKSGKILTLKPWYHGLQNDDCSIKSPGASTQEQSRFVWRIILNIVEDLLQLSGYVAIGFVIYGGFLFMTSTGIPEKAARGRNMVLFSMIGLVIAMASIGLVNLVAEAAIGG